MVVAPGPGVPLQLTVKLVLVVVAGKEFDGAGGQANDSNRGLGACRRRLDVAEVVGGDTVEAVAVTELAGEGRRSQGRVGQEGRERPAVVRLVDCVRRDARRALDLASRSSSR